jgi:cytidine deaminase
MSDDMLEAARQALTRAYAPYSRHRVGAAVRGASGAVHAGCNVENAAYPESTCAEAAAIAALVLAGETRLVEVLVMGETDVLCSPCGGCRQKLREFGAASVPVHIAGPEGVRKTLTLGELLPDAFGPDNLTCPPS